MTKDEEKLLERLRSLGKIPAIIEPATVVSVDKEQMTCVVELNDETELSDVRLKAAIDGVNQGVVQFPVPGSTVLVAAIGNKVGVRAVIMVSEVDEVVINGGQNGGLINIQNLVEQLNKTNQVVNAIKDSLLNWTPVPNDGGAALQVYANSQLLGKDTGDFDSEELEDVKVKH